MTNIKAYDFLAMGLILSFLAGCNGPNAVTAKPRGESSKPLIASANTVENGDPGNTKATELRDVGFGERHFIKPDHFGCIVINAPHVLANKELTDVPWSELENGMADLVGTENAHLDRIERIWLLLDSEFFQLAQSAPNGDSPLVLVVEYKNPVDQAGIPASTNSNKSDTIDLADPGQTGKPENPVPNSMVAIAIDEKTIAIGSPKALDKLGAETNERSPLAAEIRKFDGDCDLVGSITMSPIRSTLRGILELTASFSEESKKWVAIPDELRSIDVHANLANTSDFFGLNLKIEDDQLRQDLIRLLSETMNSGNGSASPAMPIGGMGGMGQPNEQMIETKSAEVISAVAREITESNLLSVKAVDETIQIELTRPQKFSELVAAMIVDANKQVELQKRITNMKKIADALKAYETKYGSLPSASAITPGGDRPAQFSWLVAILPFVGHQELYDQFDFSEPWDSQKNMQVAENIPSEIRSTPDSIKTAFQLVTGENAIFNPENPLPRTEEIKDLKIWTALVMESATANQVWTEPLSATDTNLNNSDFLRDGEKGTLMIDATFNVRALKDSLDAFQSVITTNGGERLGRSNFFRIEVN